MSFWRTTSLLGVFCAVEAIGSPAQTFRSLVSFNGTNGPYSLVQGVDGGFYGTSCGGGAQGDGTLFSLSVGLGPFVETLPTSGREERLSPSREPI
jgi:uncharacterized repeat protein (TIGR03803 family)